MSRSLKNVLISEASFICLFSEGIESIAIAQILSKNNKNCLIEY
jgi:hypothetical protein